MAGESQRQLILTAIADRLKTITVANGFATDAGKNVYLGVDVNLDSDKIPAAIAVAVGDEQPAPGSRTQICYDLPYEIQAVVGSDIDDPWITIEAMIGDIKKAIEQTDRTLGKLVNRNGDAGLERGPVSNIAREKGSSTIGVSVTYIAKLQESWGNP